MSLNGYLSGGYLITQYVDTTSSISWVKDWWALQGNLLPAAILSVGFCASRFAPLLSWAGASDQDYADFGVPENQRAELEAWANERFDVDIGYPHIFFQLLTAREYISRFVQNPQQLQVLGIGVHVDDLVMLLEAEALNPATTDPSGAHVAGFAGSGFARAVSRGEPPTQGEVLGFDVIACRYQIDHAWHCNSLAKDGWEQFHFRPNQFGLIDDKTNADKLAAYANEELIEDSIWLPVLVSRHPVQSV
ncbi:MAG: hypothetical protein KF716_10120 [Anaerolineae bacterium]|nr:hypothetical protein [Anaerolineae bacterium]